MTTDDVVAIHQLLGLYGHVVDGDDLSRLATVFTGDAVFDATEADAGRIEGLDAIRTFFERGKPPHPPAHHSTNFYVYEEDGEARAQSKWTTIDRVSGGTRSGDYHDVLVKSADGWRIRSRYVTVRWYVGVTPGAAA
jgi:hypothetical protein